MKAKNNTFSLTRLFFLGKRQVLGNLSGFLIAFGAFAGTLLVISLLAGYSDPGRLSRIAPLFYVALFIGGYVFTSNIFAELHSPQRSIPFLTLPVSKLERLLNAWLLTAILFPVLALLSYALVVFLAHLILGVPLTATAFSMVWSKSAFNVVMIYVITQSIFLFGAIYFRKHNFIRTLLSLFVLQIVISIFLTIIVYLLFGKTHFSEEVFVQQTNLSPAMEQFFTKTLVDIAKFSFNYLLVPFFLMLTWFGIKERQV
ncbi:MAG: hypothetical protein K0B09_04970 [Bacteroidales bacterium]|nr:hypothetical protein [Bacteroidales bacterium]